MPSADSLSALRAYSEAGCMARLYSPGALWTACRGGGVLGACGKHGLGSGMIGREQEGDIVMGLCKL